MIGVNSVATFSRSVCLRAAMQTYSHSIVAGGLLEMS
jgi:hypothetical protein